MGVRAFRLPGAVVGVLLWLPAPAAVGADFHFTVPVRLQNLLPDVASISVVCFVFSETDELVANYARGIAIDPSTGSYDEIIEFRVNANTGRRAEEAVRYQCRLSLRTEGLAEFGPACSTQYPWTTPKEGTACSAEVGGPIPSNGELPEATDQGDRKKRKKRKPKRGDESNG